MMHLHTSPGDCAVFPEFVFQKVLIKKCVVHLGRIESKLRFIQCVFISFTLFYHCRVVEPRVVGGSPRNHD